LFCAEELKCRFTQRPQRRIRKDRKTIFSVVGMTENEISYRIIGIAFELHRNIGPGLLESAYENALRHDLQSAGLIVRGQVPMPFVYKDVKLEIGYRIDLVVNEKVLVEVKSIEALAPVHYAQTLTYLKLSGLKLGLLINFNTKILKDSIHRIVNKL
jgi:GxxExxY protein